MLQHKVRDLGLWVWAGLGSAGLSQVSACAQVSLPCHR